jgi:amidase
MSAYNPKLKAPYNPWDATMSPGGSSSGSGVATAAGMCFGSVGSDTGGSIRFPSAMCGVVGLKPTWGRVSRYGVLDLAQSLDHVGPMTRTVTDAAIILDAIAGEDPNDPTTFPGTTPAFAAQLRKGVRGLRIGYAEEYATKGIDPETAQAVKAALPVLDEQGAVVIETRIPDVSSYISAWRDICTSEAFTAHSAYYPTQAASYGPWFRSWLAHGSSISAADYARAHQTRLKCNGIIAKAFQEIDVLVCPAMLGPDKRKTDQELFETPMTVFDSSRQRFTVPYDFNGAPTVTMPSALNKSGFPLSVQFVAKPGREDLALRAARAFERVSKTTELHPAV